MGTVATMKELSVYRGRNVLVTGDTGFKGSWLATWLHHLGAWVWGYSLPPATAEDHFVLLKLGDLIRHTDGDIRDLRRLQRTFEEAQPEFVFHLAAQSLVRMSYEDPKRTFDTNVGGSVNLLEAVRTSSSVKALVYVTSDKCYRNREWVWGYRENDELGGSDPYSASKAAAELVFGAYLEAYFRRRHDFGAATVRAGNVIGGGDWAQDRVVPDCIRALRDGRFLVLRNPQATRPWQHVLDPLFGYLLLGARLLEHPTRYAGAWNFGPGGGAMRTVRELAERVIEHWGYGTISVANQEGPHEATLLHLNCDKANHFLGWLPRWSFERAVQKTVEWYKRVASGEPARTVTLSHIEEYMEQ